MSYPGNGTRLPVPRVGPTDACEREQRHPRQGQMTFDLDAAEYVPATVQEQGRQALENVRVLPLRRTV